MGGFSFPKAGVHFLDKKLKLVFFYIEVNFFVKKMNANFLKIVPAYLHMPV